MIPLLSKIEGLTDVRSEFSGAQQEVMIQIDRQTALSIGANLADLTTEEAQAYFGACYLPARPWASWS
ncbi:protein of unknown function, might belong to Acriflavin resistance protei [Shewanella benthica]|uniref:Uncharacterized protein n=1 Tax=Shewanella benthica TaxID=43661 RepID=A0A330M3F2_9GAMM|nr:protein of unknown function, might belong to Acriflavin resistance protei [Shewanella benthica]